MSGRGAGGAKRKRGQYKQGRGKGKRGGSKGKRGGPRISLSAARGHHVIMATCVAAREREARAELLDLLNQVSV